MTVPPIDVALLQRRTLGDAELQKDLLRLFAAHTPAVLADLNTAIQSSNDAAAASAAHRLRGSASTIAATRLTDCLADLEDALRQNVRTAASICGQIVDVEFARCIRAINDLLAGENPA